MEQIDTGPLLEVVTSADAAELVRNYWAHTLDSANRPQWYEPVSSVADAYGIASNQLLVVLAENSVARVVTPTCSCGRRIRVANRTEVASVRAGRGRCETCVDVEREARDAEARKALELRAAAEADEIGEMKRRQTAVETHYAIEASGKEAWAEVLSDEWSTEHPLACLVMLRALLRQADSNGLIGPLDAMWPPRFPTDDDWAWAIMKKLGHVALRVHPSSDIEAFNWKSLKPTTYYVGRVMYCVDGVGQLNGRARDAVTIVDELLNRGWPVGTVEESVELAGNLLEFEAVRYFTHCVKRHALPGPDSDDIVSLRSFFGRA